MTQKKSIIYIRSIEQNRCEKQKKTIFNFIKLILIIIYHKKQSILLIEKKNDLFKQKISANTINVHLKSILPTNLLLFLSLHKMESTHYHHSIICHFLHLFTGCEDVSMKGKLPFIVFEIGVTLSSTIRAESCFEEEKLRIS